MRHEVTPDVVQKLHDPMAYLSDEEVRAYRRKEMRFVMCCIAVSIGMIIISVAAFHISRNWPRTGSSGRYGGGLGSVWFLVSFSLTPYALYRLAAKRKYISKRARSDMTQKYDGLYKYENQRKAAEWQVTQQRARKAGIPFLLVVIAVIAIVLWFMIQAL